MKRLHQVLGLGALTLVLSTPVLFNTPVLAELQRVGQAVAQNLQREPQIQLNLLAEKKVTVMDQQGQPVISWQNLGSQATVQPGDVLRFKLKGQNTSDRDVRNLEVTQPVPNQMKYMLNSAAVDQSAGAEITYSIDGGKTFVADPTIEVKQPDGSVVTRPAPAEMYTHIHWNFGKAVSAGTILNATYQVEVR